MIGEQKVCKGAFLTVILVFSLVNFLLSPLAGSVWLFLPVLCTCFVLCYDGGWQVLYA